MPNITELENFHLGDAVKFHNRLNPVLWMGDHLKDDVREHLLKIAQDFVTYLGVKDLDVKDVTISGSNAAYSYTKHSDLDLHIIIDIDKLTNDEVYRELFNAKKTLYNDTYDIEIKGIPVELYVQDSKEPHVSLGEFSLMHNKWIHIPKKRRANFDELATKVKFNALRELVELAIKTRNIDRVEKVVSIIKRYRKAGLDKAGEFGPENLAYKAIRKQGGIQQLYDLKNELHGEKLSIEEALGMHSAIQKLCREHGIENRDIILADNAEPINETIEESQILNLIAEKATTTLIKYIKMKDPGFLDFIFANDMTTDFKNKSALSYGLPLKNIILPIVHDPVIKELIATTRITVDNENTVGEEGEPYNLGTAYQYKDSTLNGITMHWSNIKHYAKTMGLSAEEVFRSTLIHELQHAIDNIKSSGKAFLANYSDDLSLGEYLRLPHEINARMQEALYIISREINRHKPETISNHALKSIILAAFEARRISIVLDKNSREYKRLVARAYKFFDAETKNPKKEKNLGLLKRAYNYILDRPTSEITETVLTELADNPYRYMQTHKSPNKISYKFQTENGKLYGVTLIVDNHNVMQVHFYLQDKYTGKIMSGIENTGDSIRVVSTVANITMKAANEYNPTAIELMGNAREPSRVKLYKAMARRAAKMIPGYQIVSDKIEGNALVILLSKTKPDDELTENNALDNPKFKAYKNPSPLALFNLTKRSVGKHMRGLYYNGDTYWWDASEIIHAAAAPWLGISYDYSCRLNAVIGYMSGKYEVDGDYGVPEKIVQRYDFHNNDFTDEELMEDKSSVVYHVTPTKNLPSIMKNGLIPQIGNRSSQIDGEEEGIYIFPSLEDLEDAHWLGDEFDEDEELSVLEIDVSGIPLVDSTVGFEKIIKVPVSPDRISVSDDVLFETEITNTPDLRIYKNLTPSRLRELTLSKHYNHTRGLYYNGNTYWWDGWGTDHQDASYIIGIEKEDYRRIHAEVVGGVYQVYTEDKGIPENIIRRYNIIDVDELVFESSDTLDPFEQIKDNLGLKQLLVTERGADLILDSLIVGKENQGKGLGSQAMKALTDYADSVGKRIILTPGVQDKNHGTTSRTRLVRFYKQFGFKENKGQTLDYSMGAGKMYRDPKSNVSEALDQPTTLYHVSKSSNRDSILNNGLLPRNKEDLNIHRRPGVYMFSLLADAKEWAHWGKLTYSEPYDIWKISLPGDYRIVKDSHPEMQEFSAVVVYDPIPANWLTLDRTSSHD